MAEKIWKRAYVVQHVGSEDSEVRHRADRVLKELIEPACAAIAYQPVRAEQLPEESIFQPVASPIATARMVIADLGTPPVDGTVLMEVGFRIANGRPIVFLVDQSIESQMLPENIRDRDAETVRIDSGQPTDENRRKLSKKILGREKAISGWQSDYPMIEFVVPLDGTQPKFIDVNAAAAKLYGVDNANQLLAMPVDSADEILMKFMPEAQRGPFTEDQARLLGEALKRSRRREAPVLAKVPAWIPNHPEKTHKSHIYWPILLQHKFSGQGVVMRVAFVPVENWDAGGPKWREMEKAIRIPELFREPKFKYDVFLSYNSVDGETVRALAQALRRFNLRVWFDEDNLSDRHGLTADIKSAMLDSMIIAAVLGTQGLGPWQNEVELRGSLNRIARGKRPFVLLLTNDVPVEEEQWLMYVPKEFKETFQDRLYLKLPRLEELKELVHLPKSGSLNFVQRFVQLLADTIHADQ